MLKRKLCALAAACVIALGVAGCGGQSGIVSSGSVDAGGSDSVASAEAASGEAESGESASASAASASAATASAAAESAAESAAADSAESATSGENASADAASGEAASGEAASGEAASGEAASSEAGSAENASADAAASDAVSTDAASDAASDAAPAESNSASTLSADTASPSSVSAFKESTERQEELNEMSLSDAANINADPLIIEEAGYTITPSGYVKYAVRLSNPNSDAGARFPKIHVTGRNDYGEIVFSDTETLRDIYPGESMLVGFQAGNGIMPSEVDFEPSVDSADWMRTSDDRQDLYTLTNMVDSGTIDGVNYFTGEITLNRAATDAYKPALSVVLRSEEDGLIYGTTTFMTSELEVGVPTPFEIRATNVPDNAVTFEIRATPWS